MQWRAHTGAGPAACFESAITRALLWHSESPMGGDRLAGGATSEAQAESSGGGQWTVAEGSVGGPRSRMVLLSESRRGRRVRWALYHKPIAGGGNDVGERLWARRTAQGEAQRAGDRWV